MRLLVDTHVFLWMAMAPTRLSDRVRALLADGQNELFLSNASVWEIAIKYQTGRLTLSSEPSLWIPLRVARHYLIELPINIDHIFFAGRLALHHRDPFDRLLVAQAQIEGLTLVTADVRLKAYDAPIVMATD